MAKKKTDQLSVPVSPQESLKLSDRKLAKEILKRVDKRKEMDAVIRKGDNARYLAHSLVLYRLPRIDLNNTQLVADRIDFYFEWCIENDMKPSVGELALALGCTRQAFIARRTGLNGSNPEVKDLFNIATSLMNAQMENYMQNGKINPVSGIFIMKNNFGYQDRTEVAISPQQPLGDMENPDLLKQKYLASMASDIPIEVDSEEINTESDSDANTN